MKYSNFDLTLYNSYRIRSVADLALFPSSKDELIRYIDEYPNSVVIGGGNNIILLQQFYKYPFLFLRENLSDYQFEGDEKIIVSAGLSMSALSEIAADKSWIGFETFYDIPGSIGGGICMNAGAGDQFISDNLVEVEAFNLETKKLEIFSKSECKFGYRDSIFKNNKKLIIVSAVFLFNRAENDVVIRQRMREIKEKRFQRRALCRTDDSKLRLKGIFYWWCSDFRKACGLYY